MTMRRHFKKNLDAPLTTVIVVEGTEEVKFVPF
jgi:hypothetical protein